MTFKKLDQLLAADPRFATLVVSDERGVRAVDLPSIIERSGPSIY